LGLLAAAFYGSADFVGGFAAKRAPFLFVTLIAQIVGLACGIVVWLLLAGHMSAGDLLWGGLGGLAGGAGIALLYHALAIGKMGVVSPITAVVGGAVPVVFGLLRGEHLAWWQFAGVAVAIVAIVMISFSVEESGQREISTAGVREALLAGVLLGAYLIGITVSHGRDTLSALVAARASSVVLLFALVLLARIEMSAYRASVVPSAWVGVIDMTANVFFVYAAATGQLAIAVVLTGLYPAATVLLARIVLKERLNFVQRIGVVLALLGVTLIAI